MAIYTSICTLVVAKMMIECNHRNKQSNQIKTPFVLQYVCCIGQQSYSLVQYFSIGKFIQAGERNQQNNHPNSTFFTTQFYIDQEIQPQVAITFLQWQVFSLWKLVCKLTCLLEYVPFLKQAHRPACAWFLKIASMRMSVCVSVPTPRLLITTGVMWHDMDPIQLVKQVLQLLYGNCSRYC